MTHKLPSFEHMASLARENPEQLEALRRQLIDRVIEEAPEAMHRRLRGLQFKIDCCRETHKSPLGSCIEISKMMYDSLHKLNLALTQTPSSEKQQDRVSAQILPFSSVS